MVIVIAIVLIWQLQETAESMKEISALEVITATRLLHKMSKLIKPANSQYQEAAPLMMTAHRANTATAALDALTSKTQTPHALTTKNARVSAWPVHARRSGLYLLVKKLEENTSYASQDIYQPHRQPADL